jgi:glucose/mannose transport system substrate-binding protein
MKIRFALLAVVALFIALIGGVGAQDVSGDLEIFSWWAGGGEAAGLEALIAEFNEQYPDVTVVNSAVSGGSGVNARAVLATRMQAGDPPGTFQIHAGSALNDLWVAADAMEPVTAIFEENGWMETYPQGLLDLISKDGEVYAVPVNIHRSNVMWYVPANLEEWGVTAPTSWEEFLTETCPTLQEAGIVPLRWYHMDTGSPVGKCRSGRTRC